jgi:hypothetical protein
MKSLVISMLLAFSATAWAGDATKAVQNDVPKKEQPNCVTKDKKGNCPAAPKSPKPTPKKKPEAK